MSVRTSCPIALLGVLILASSSVATAPGEYSWKYYRPGNTGVMGDYSTALWIDPTGTLYLGGFDPFFEEGGFSRFIEAENRWENFSNVDYPVIGDTGDTYGSPRISDILPDPSGALWMGTARGLLYFDPSIGAESLTRYDYTTSPLPNASVFDICRAPDGTIWLAAYSGGLVRFDPATNTSTIWGFGDNSNGWPGWSTPEAVTSQPKPGGGYTIWVDDAFGIASYDSDTDTFTEHPSGSIGDIYYIPRNDPCDSAGNTWMLREKVPGTGTTLEYCRVDGTWVQPPQPPFAFYGFGAFRALDGGRALLIGGNSEAWYFDGTQWINYGSWRPGGFTYAIDRDDDGNIWVSGNGGAAKYSAELGTWQRYRLTNTGMMDNFLRDISFAPNGDVWVTENGGPGIGGIGVFDGDRWHSHNVLTYGLGEPWPFAADNADAIVFRSSTGKVAFNPTNHGLHEWDGNAYTTIEELGTSDGLAEDSFGRLWSIGNYFNLRYLDETGFHDVEIAGWGSNIVADPSRPGTVWACANLEVVRSDGTYYFSRENADLPELNVMHDVLTTLAVEPGGAAWVGSTEGLFRIDPETGTHQWWHSSNSTIPVDQAQPLVVSPDGLIWFTNWSMTNTNASLLWFDGTEWGMITREDGLPHAQIYDAEVREIPGGYEIWLACASRGIGVLTVMNATTSVAGNGVTDGRLTLMQNSPNPFSSSTTLAYSLAAASPVRIEVFDALGRRIRTLMDGREQAGAHTLRWDGLDNRGRPVGSGVYFYRVETPASAHQRRMTLIR